MRILFVDDEPMLLDAMRRLLRAKRPAWEVACASSGQRALALLDAGSFDVVVSDMRMPGLDGASLLKLVRERQPQAVRIVLSGFADEEASFRAAGVAHQCVAKPCSIASLEEVIQQAEALHLVLRDPGLRAVLGSVDSLPAAPTIYRKLTELLDHPEMPIHATARVVSQDRAIASKLLQLVNSAFFGVPHGVSDLGGAVRLLGLRTVHGLVVGYEVIRTFAGDSDPAGLSVAHYQRHALSVANLARRLAPGDGAESAFVAGLLHDTGKLVLATRLPSVLAADRARAKAEGVPTYVIERRRHGYTHAEIGAYLLALWGLPGGVVEAVAHHHTPSGTAPGGELDLPGLIHVADALVHEAGNPEAASRLDPAYVDAAGLAGRLASWRPQALQAASLGQAAA
jgi:HD-like signal output (HDOD) protein/CheY-like chemotaxis protein